MTDATVPRRFGFKGSTISQLPTTTTSLASIKTKTSTLQSTDVDDSTSDTTMNGVPIDIDVRVLEKFKETFGEETIREFSNLSAAMDDKITEIKTALGRRLAVLEHAAKTKDHSEAERRQLKVDLDIMQKSMKQI
ncbi:hypothetical protein PsorP6_014010 [Peronosclerospora sorghi]|uniref:Uncharacterized protein n=1 Tax=Peronosclerospora sorghi TaxID=230839 RepID=A0ACC0VI40_9STRA|nr:hypothetical protein PsorP6_014010 [Peronosclerospora sorghi]